MLRGLILASDGTDPCHGLLFPALSNQGLPASLVLSGSELIVTATADGAVLVSVEFSATEISERIGNIPRKVTFADGSVFETTDNDAIDRLVASQGPHFWNHIHGLEQFRPRMIGFVAAIAMLAYLIYQFTLPLLVEVAVWVTPSFVPEMMSAGTLKTLDTTVMGPTLLPEDTQKKISAGFEKLVAASNHAELKFKLNFRNGGVIGPNAFALPDGNVILTDQLVALASGDTEMVFGVLAHEIGHVEMKHSLRQMYQAAGTYGLIAMITGDIGSGMQDVLSGGAGFLALANSRSAEGAADMRSVELMSDAGYDPTAIARFFKIIETKLGDTSETSILSTHPGTPDREKAILDYSKKLGQKI